jgi:hypothetical protein
MKVGAIILQCERNERMEEAELLPLKAFGKPNTKS